MLLYVNRFSHVNIHIILHINMQSIMHMALPVYVNVYGYVYVYVAYDTARTMTIIIPLLLLVEPHMT